MRGDRPLAEVPREEFVGFTPHARGSTLPLHRPHLHGRVYPACAGIDPTWAEKWEDIKGLPRMRGDRPTLDDLSFTAKGFTPHARGSTSLCIKSRRHRQVYPACAGIDRTQRASIIKAASLPRMRGDRPRYFRIFGRRIGFTPHARGSTSGHVHHGRPNRVYPACAGIDLSAEPPWSRGVCLPRMRGDRPFPIVRSLILLPFTPHARGSTLYLCLPTKLQKVYPACAGIDPLL